MDKERSSMLNYLIKNWIAILSLIISITVLYINYLQGFRLQIREVGRIQIAKNPFSEGLKQSCLFLDLIFSNRGAKTGVVEDVAISVNERGNPTILRSLFVVTDRTKHFQKELQPPQMESFTAFELGKQTSLAKEIMFVPFESELAFFFKAGTYDADVWAVSSKKGEWVKYASFVFTVKDEDIKALDTTTITPQSGGGYFIKWITQDKPLESSEERLKNLKLKILESSR